LLFSVIPEHFFVIPNASEESTAWMLRCAQHDRMGTAKLTLLSLSLQKERDVLVKPKQGEVARSSEHFFVIPSIFFCHSKCSFLSFRAPARNPVWMLRCAQHDRMGTAKLTLLSLSLQKERGWQPHPVALRRPSPSQGEGRFGESQNRVRSHGLPSTFLSFRAFSFVIPEHFFCHSERSEESSVDAALSVTGTLTSPQPSPSQGEEHLFFFIPSASEESSMDASLRSA